MSFVPPVSIQLNHVFGVDPTLRDSAIHIDDIHIAFPAGRHIAVFNLETKEMLFAPSDERVKSLAALAISPNRKYLAVSERTLEQRAQVTVIGAQSLRRLRTLVLPEAREFTALAFSGDSRYLATQTDGPDFLLAYWHWEKSKMMASTKVQSKVTRISVNPSDSAQLATTGPRLCKQWRLVERSLKGFNLLTGKEGRAARDLPNVTDHSWIGGDVMVFGTDRGDISLFDKIDLVQSLKAVLPHNHGVTAMTRCNKGFVLGGTGGFLKVYEYTSEKDGLSVVKEFTTEGHHAVTGLSVAPSGDACLCCFSNNQLGLFSMAIREGDDVRELELLFGGFHSSAVTGLDTSLTKPIVITCGPDKVVQAWNYLTKSCELSHAFEEEPLAIALHPSGFRFAVAFADHITMFTLLMGDCRPDHDFPVKQCRELHFAYGGHLLACVSHTSVMVFSTYSFEHVETLANSHTGPIRAIAFTKDDRRIVTAGTDGALYEWSTDSWKRLSDNVIRRVQYEVVGYTQDNQVVAAASDRLLRVFEEGQQQIESSEGGGHITQIVLTEHALLAATTTGTVQIYSLPLQGETPSVVETGVHVGPIRRMRLSDDGKYLFTCGDDGSVFVMSVDRIEGGRTASRPVLDLDTIAMSDLVLVRKSDVEDMQNSLRELEGKLREVQTQTEYRLYEKDMQYGDMMRHQHSQYEEARAGDEERFRELQREKDQQEIVAAETIQALEGAHMKAAEELESLYEKKLDGESRRFEALEKSKSDLQLRYEETQHVQLRKFEKEIAELKEVSEAREQALKDEIVRQQRELVTIRNEYEEEIHQQEEDHERELHEAKTTASSELTVERDKTAFVRGEAALLRRRFDKISTKQDQMEQVIRDGVTKQEEQVGQMRLLNDKITHLNKELREKDATLSLKERRIFELKQKNQELDKFRFVLDFKLAELRKEMDPKEEFIADMKKQIKEMDDELQRHIHNADQLQLQVTERQMKLDNLGREIGKIRTDSSDKDKLIRSFVQDLHDLYTQTDSSRWRDGIRQMYRHYVTHDAEKRLAKEDAEKMMEFARQRDYMERSLHTLRHKASKVDTRTKVELKRKLDENTVLIGELNLLRRENRELTDKLALCKDRLDVARAQAQTIAQRQKTQGRLSQMEAVRAGHSPSPHKGSVRRGTMYARSPSPEQAAIDRKTISELISTVEDNNRTIEVQRNEIHRLRDQLGSIISSALPDLSTSAGPMVVGSAEPLPGIGRMREDGVAS